MTDRSPTAGQRPNTKIDTTRPHDPGTILTQTARTLDFAQPIALILQGILGHVPDEDGPGEIVARLVDALPSGSYVVIADGTNPTGAGLPDEVDGFGGVARKP